MQQDGDPRLGAGYKVRMITFIYGLWVYYMRCAFFQSFMCYFYRSRSWKVMYLVASVRLSVYTQVSSKEYHQQLTMTIFFLFIIYYYLWDRLSVFVCQSISYSLFSLKGGKRLAAVCRRTEELAAVCRRTEELAAVCRRTEELAGG